MKSTKTKYENNWEEKSLENLEKDFWSEATSDSRLVKTCHLLRKKTIKNFEIEDLRVMIGQNIGLKFLIPSALNKLTADILAEGDYCKGDLLKSVLTIEAKFWTERPDLFNKLDKVIQDISELLNQHMPELIRDFENQKTIIK